ncbi:lycopene cyclase family protein [Actinoplanes rectilineatus]|uniref:lycopene cyclase family protein n=1 Tax=Actinoplanes rectilineatus TaxID=113571 RepID=UPI0005F2960E|nr:lycopene cyclase family protein [Actinoplanes rectilineatus]
MDVDLALVGNGGAASLLLDALARHGIRDLRIATIDPGDGDRHRTWAFWTGATDDLDPVLEASWTAVDLYAPQRRTLELGPTRYAMVRSAPVFARAEQAADRLGVKRIIARAAEVLDEGTAVTVRDPHGDVIVRAEWVLDSRPAKPARPGRTSWLQHFRGWWVRSAEPVFDPRSAVLMDFRTPQPPRGVSFGYVLPTGAHTALIEYTEFSPQRLEDAAYVEALSAYTRGLGLDPDKLLVEQVEDGAIPMTDAPFTLRPSPRVVRLGTAGGATRPSTGYTFSAMRRQADQIAAALARGGDPVPNPAYPRRHLWMDAVALRAWDRGLVPAPAFFERLFMRNSPSRVLRFLDGRTSPTEEVALMASTPLLPMTRAAAGDLLARFR